MQSFKQKLKSNVLSPYNKNNLSYEKVGEILDTDTKKGTCTVMYKNNEGILMTKEDIPCKKSARGIVNGFPKKGDKVEIKESGNTIRITGVIDDKEYTQKDSKTYDMVSSISDFGGYLGI